MKKVFVFLAVCFALSVASPMAAKADGFSLQYIVTIEDPSTGMGHVHVDIPEPPSDSLTLCFDNYQASYYSWLHAEDNMSNLSVKDQMGNPLSIEDVQLDDSTSCFKVIADGNSLITVDYDLSFGFPYPDNPYSLVGGYLGPSFGVIEPSLLFLVPTVVENTSEVTVQFDLGVIAPVSQLASRWCSAPDLSF